MPYEVGLVIKINQYVPIELVEQVNNSSTIGITDFLDQYQVIALQNLMLQPRKNKLALTICKSTFSGNLKTTVGLFAYLFAVYV